ncbi:MAG TPA: mechanosensitive ion channel domain-containing protein [Vicinamibacterales bacterium]|nr:mechanosensitive ion channel domain-containing protein [Vicinamibacterales bacterium]
MAVTRFGAAIVMLLWLAAPAAARQVTPAPAGSDPIPAAVAAAAKTAVAAEESATLYYSNRAIVELRATVLSRPPRMRAAAATDALDRLVAEFPAGRVATRTFDDAIVIGIDTHPVIALYKADADPLEGEELASKAAATAARLQVAFDEAVELHTPRRVLTGLVVAVTATAIYIVALWLLVRLHRRGAMRLSMAAERRLSQLPGGDIIVGIAHAPQYVRSAFTIAVTGVGLILTYGWVTILLRRFPYTRPWGESLRGALFNVALSGARAFVDELPNLLTVLGIVVVVRFLSRLTSIAFAAVEQGRISLPGIYPETAQPTRRIVVALLWIFALVVSYEYLPGSESDAFKGASVFVGLVVSLGSTGIMNQVMSGLMLTYSRAVRLGDFVRIGDVEGTVVHLGTLSTKVKNARNEEITIPNAVVVANATTNFSLHAASEGVYAPTSVTIGYDVPWRQVHALLLLAAGRTPGLRSEPKPVVLQTGLQDFYVHYTLLVALEQPNRRYMVLAALHANIQDAFNEYGVQIMSPNYEADPNAPKVVPPSRWYSSPAAPPSDAAVGSAVGNVDVR